MLAPRLGAPLRQPPRLTFTIKNGQNLVWRVGLCATACAQTSVKPNSIDAKPKLAERPKLLKPQYIEHKPTLLVVLLLSCISRERAGALRWRKQQRQRQHLQQPLLGGQSNPGTAAQRGCLLLLLARHLWPRPPWACVISASSIFACSNVACAAP